MNFEAMQCTTALSPSSRKVIVLAKYCRRVPRYLFIIIWSRYFLGFGSDGIRTPKGFRHRRNPDIEICACVMASLQIGHLPTVQPSLKELKRAPKKATMMRLSLTVFATLSIAASATEILTFIGEGAVTASDGKASHYGNPTAGCREDERGFQIQGVPGEICAPKCTAFRPCPSDVPEGATAKPACALKASDGNTYCALLCDPSEEVGTSMLRPPGGMRARGDMCGEATCQSIGGAGICTWSD